MLSLGTVNARANRLAHELLGACGTRPEEPVAVLLDRSGWAVSSALAVLKAGACYFPLSPEFPDERIALLLRDSGCRTVVAQPRLHERLRALDPSLTLVDPAAATGDGADPAPRARPAGAATLLYTSGSTGSPKGVLVEHRSLTNLLAALEPMLYAPLGGRTREALSAPFVFDAALQQMLSCLANGSTLFVVDEDTRRDPHAFIDYLVRHDVQTINVVASFLGALVDAGLPHRAPASLRHVVTGGEAVPAATIRRLFGHPAAAAVAVFSMYGPTEACVDTTCCRVDAATPIEWAHVPLGEPLQNVWVDVRDERLAPCEAGTVGEVCIGGAGLARGYLRERPGARAAFVEAPDAPGGRLYRTGDLGRVQADGTLEFVGRADDQVKVRGHRVELGEVEHALAAHEGVREVAVVAVDAGAAGKELVACAAAAPDAVTAASLRARAAERLPPWSVPTRYIVADTLPHTHNGKLDRAELARMAVHAAVPVSSGAGSGGRTPLERELASIVAGVLGTGGVGRDDDFFALGCHSLAAMQVVNRVIDRWGVTLPLRSVFEHPSVAALAAALEPLVAGGEDGVAREPIAAVPAADDYPLSRAQERLWAVAQDDAANAAYSVPVVMAQGPLDRAALEFALSTVAGRHEALRTAFRAAEGEPRQAIAERVDVPLEWCDVSGEPDPERAARAVVRRDMDAPFDLTAAPLARAKVIELDRARTWFVLTMHHLVCDGWSIGILSRELNEAYRARLGGHEPDLPALPVRYVDYAQWDRARDVTAAMDHWRDRLQGVAPWLELPTDFARDPAAHDFRGATVERDLEPGLAGALRRVAAARRTTLASVMLSLYAWLLHRLTRHDDLCVGMGVAGRSHPDIEGVVGFFVNVLPIRLRLAPDLELDALLEQVDGTLRAALDAQDTPLDAIVRELALPRRPGVQPLVNVMFAYQSFADVAGAVPPPAGTDGATGLALDQSRLVDVPLATSKFDLTLYVYERSGGLRVAFEYDDRLFRAETIERYLATLERLAGLVAAERPA
jgi:amino acid adenylation domain-containing protein